MDSKLYNLDYRIFIYFKYNLMNLNTCSYKIKSK